MGLKEDIKSYIAISGLTLKQIQEELNKRNNTNHSVQNLSKKINNETLRYNEIKQIADIIGYEIQWMKKQDYSVYKNTSKQYNNYISTFSNIMHYFIDAMESIPPEVVEYALDDKGQINPDKLKECLSQEQYNRE
ncbi:UNVERIFIED_ORG: hypothetical protein B2H93_13420 [Clostridium botulinum]